MIRSGLRRSSSLRRSLGDRDDAAPPSTFSDQHRASRLHAGCRRWNRSEPHHRRPRRRRSPGQARLVAGRSTWSRAGRPHRSRGHDLPGSGAASGPWTPARRPLSVPAPGRRRRLLLRAPALRAVLGGSLSESIEGWISMNGGSPLRESRPRPSTLHPVVPQPRRLGLLRSHRILSRSHPSHLHPARFRLDSEGA